MEIQTQARCSGKIYQQRFLLALWWPPANTYPLGHCSVCCFLRNTALTHDLLSMSDFPITFLAVAVSRGFFYNPAFHNNSCIQVSLLESCKHLLQCRAGDLLSVSVPLGRFTAWTSFSITGCCYCLNNYRMQKVMFWRKKGQLFGKMRQNNN